MKLLLIEDEIGLSDALCQSFKNEKYMIEARYDGESGLDEALTGIYDAIILDVMRSCHYTPTRYHSGRRTRIRRSCSKKLSFISSSVCIKATRGVGYSLEDSL